MSQTFLLEVLVRHKRSICSYLRGVTGRTYRLHDDRVDVSDDGLTAFFFPAEYNPRFKIQVSDPLRDGTWTLTAGFEHSRRSLRTSYDTQYENSGLSAQAVEKLFADPAQMLDWVGDWWSQRMPRTASDQDLWDGLVRLAHSKPEHHDSLLPLILKHRPTGQNL